MPFKHPAARLCHSWIKQYEQGNMGLKSQSELTWVYFAAAGSIFLTLHPNRIIIINLYSLTQEMATFNTVLIHTKRCTGVATGSVSETMLSCADDCSIRIRKKKRCHKISPPLNRTSTHHLSLTIAGGQTGERATAASLAEATHDWPRLESRVLAKNQQFSVGGLHNVSIWLE